MFALFFVVIFVNFCIIVLLEQTSARAVLQALIQIKGG